MGLFVLCAAFVLRFVLHMWCVCVYFACVGGAAALIAKSIKKEEILCYEDLGTEAIRRYTVEDFPCIVAIDSYGNNAYTEGQKDYCRE